MTEAEIITLWYLAACATCDATGTFRDATHRDTWATGHARAHGPAHHVHCQTATTRIKT
jgi:hypothetical protein